MAANLYSSTSRLGPPLKRAKWVPGTAILRSLFSVQIPCSGRFNSLFGLKNSLFGAQGIPT